MKISERNLQEIGKSLLVSLPKEWTRALKLRKGSSVKIIISEQGNLMIAPEFTHKEEIKESEIVYDEYFERNFFRDYFNGNQKITMLLKNSNKKEKEKINMFLSRFMNVQTIEESSERIVLKSFKIEDLSIEECLKRMYFLSLGLFESKEEDLRNSITRFYYILVMQVRRFLEEGKFTKENQISLIRAMDFRMIAEKIQRISETLAKEKRKPEKDIENLYSDAIMSFLNSNYEKALKTWKEEKSLEKKYNKDDFSKLLLKYIKEISMLIR